MANMPQDVIDAVTRAGFDVYMRHVGDSYMYFTDGIRIAYLECGGIRGLCLSTVHVPNRQTGTGFSLHEVAGMSDLTKSTLERGFCHAPNWASSQDRESTVKWKSIEAFLNADSWNKSFACVAKGAVNA